MCRVCAEHLQAGLKELGLELFVADPAARLPTVNTIKVFHHLSFYLSFQNIPEVFYSLLSPLLFSTGAARPCFSLVNVDTATVCNLV